MSSNKIVKLETNNNGMIKGKFQMNMKGKVTEINTWIGVNGNRFYTTKSQDGSKRVFANTEQLKKNYRIFNYDTVESIEKFFFEGVN